MDDLRCEQFFREPRQAQHRQYEALLAFFLDRRPMPDIARQFVLAHGTLRNLVLQFRAQCAAGQWPPFSFHHDAGDLSAETATTAPRAPRRRPSPIAAPSP